MANTKEYVYYNKLRKQKKKHSYALAMTFTIVFVSKKVDYVNRTRERIEENCGPKYAKTGNKQLSHNVNGTCNRCE